MDMSTKTLSETPLYVTAGSAVEQDIANAINVSVVHGGWAATIIGGGEAHRRHLERECESQDAGLGVYSGVDLDGKVWNVKVG